MTVIRGFRPGEEAALAEICLRTAASGADATGLLTDDSLWADVFLLPYLEHAPDLALVLTDDGDEPLGYIVGTTDTAAFEDWFRREWWPARRREVAVVADGRSAWPVAYADGVGSDRTEVRQVNLEHYPAHLHIDLLPAAQGRGGGRALIDTLVTALRDRGVPGVHLTAGAENEGALAFYPRVGFTEIAHDGGSVTFAKSLT